MINDAAERRRYERLLDDWPCKRKTIRFIPNFGYQEGAVGAAHIAFSSGWFDGYDWVIRMNPDVVIYNENPLFALMERPDNWGVFGACKKGPFPCRQHSGCGLTQKGFWTHTDFNAVRPDRVPRDAFNVSGAREMHGYPGVPPSNVHAESQATGAFRDIFSARADAYIWRQDVDNNCRIRGGGVWHTTEHCPTLLNAWQQKTPPWHRSFCFEELPSSRSLITEACWGHAERGALIGKRINEQSLFAKGGRVKRS